MRNPLSVSDEGDPSNERNIIVWMDRRKKKLELSIEKGTPALNTVGGVISPEMEVPKIMWLSNINLHVREKLFDLADYLAWRSTALMYNFMCTRSASGTSTRIVTVRAGTTTFWRASG